MLFAGVVISAVAMFLGIVTKLTQGGRGLANNLVVLSFFLPAPPLSPLPLSKTILFDLETALAENRIFSLRNSVATGNGTHKKAREGWGKEKGACFTAAAKEITRWQAVRLAIRQLPEINSHTNILRSLGLIEDYLSDKPKGWENGTRYLERGER